MKIPLTLCLVIQNNQILLGLKKRGFATGLWNGFGGKLEPGETVEQAARRELTEEVGIEAVDLTQQAILEFEFENDPMILEAHVFRVTKFTGTPIETEEMKPQWYDLDKIPFEQMWSDDVYWVPLFLQNKKFKGKFVFDRPSDAEYSAKVISHHLEEVTEL